MLIGELAAGTQVVAREFSDGDHSFVYKIAQLRNVREISYKDYPLLAAVQPPRVTISSWPSIATQLRAIFEGGETTLGCFISPSQPVRSALLRVSSCE